MQKVIKVFVERLDQSSRVTELRDTMLDAVRQLDLRGFSYFSFPRTHPTEPPIVIPAHPEGWIDHYLGARYDTVDPVVSRLKTTLMPFAWGTGESLRGISERQLQMFSEAREFGIRYGLAVPIHGEEGRRAAVLFVSDQAERAFLKTAEKLQHELHLMAMLFHVQTTRTLAPESASGPHLTPREMECLRWSAEGKSQWEVAQVLGIRRRTAVFHLENAKRKLGVSSTTEAVARSIRAGTTSCE